MTTSIEIEKFTREYWTGDSRDGAMVNGDGFHFFRMSPQGLIQEAYELYENDEGHEIVTPMPDMHNIDWIKDLGFEDFEILEDIDLKEFERVKSIFGDNPD